MNISFIGNNNHTQRLAYFMTKSGINTKGVFDISIQKAVEFASQNDCMAFTDICEITDNSDIIFMSEKDNLKVYLSMIKENMPSNKIFCILSSQTTSDKIYTNESNTHFSIYSPYIFSSGKEKMPSPHFVIEGFGIRHSDFCEFLISNKISFEEIKVDDAMRFYAAISLFTSGTETILRLSEGLLSMLSLKDNHILKDLMSYLADDKNETCSFFTNDTYSVIKTIEGLREFESTAVLSLYKILGLNALEYADYNKNEKEHFAHILMDNKK